MGAHPNTLQSTPALDSPGQGSTFLQIQIVQLSYAIGVAYPLAIHVDSYDTAPSLSGKTDAELVEIVKANFDLRPGCIVRDLQLRRPVMQKTAIYGHFGREDEAFTWEKAKELSL